jgi:hypothetical protein
MPACSSEMVRGEVEGLELVERVRPGSSGSGDYMGMRRIENVEEPRNEITARPLIRETSTSQT